MIRKAEPQDTDTILSIWLSASIIAHSFIPSSYWESKLDDMRNIYLPSCKTFIYEDDITHLLEGFICMDGDILAAIFVSADKQGKGIGKQLVNFIKSKQKQISLSVYAKNYSSIEFYKKQGFNLSQISIDNHTGEEEYIMTYSSL